MKTAGTKKRLGWFFAASILVGVGGQSLYAATPFFDWGADSPAQATTAGFVPTFNLSDQTVDSLVSYFVAHPTQTFAVKVRDGVQLSDATLQKIYGNGTPAAPYSGGRPFNVSYTFVDYESNASQIGTLQSRISGFTTGASSLVGNFGYAPLASDSSLSASRPQHTTSDFNSAGLTMANEQLYPGDAGFKTPNQLGGTSTAPNIRSALFMLPLTHFNQVAANVGTIAHIPYVTRFNNANNPAFDTVHDGTGVPKFDTSKSAAVANQLLSRDDFQAMILHYRMRGATSFHLLDPGVVGYTQAQYESDAATGWNNSLVSTILGSGGMGFNLQGAQIKIDGSALQNIEDAGVVYSVVANTTQLALLISNLSPSNHTVNIQSRVNGANLIGNFIVGAGHHGLISFTKSGTSWVAGAATNPGDPNNLYDAFNDAGLNDRNGIGIPEPTSISLLAMGAIGVLVRRRRRN